LLAGSAAHLLSPPLCPQAQAQAGIIEQQQLRLRDLEGSARQWEARCSDLREVLAGHEQRAKEAAAEVLKGNQIIEKLSVSGAAVARVTVWHAPLHALQSAAVWIAHPLHINTLYIMAVQRVVCVDLLPAEHALDMLLLSLADATTRMLCLALNLAFC
jgi:hypothetical protein